MLAASHKDSGAVTAIDFRIDIFQQHHAPVVRQNLAILRTGRLAERTDIIATATQGALLNRRSLR
jgi:hypothetical protein